MASKPKNINKSQVYNVTYHGQYNGRSEAGGFLIRNFECNFRITEQVKETYSALGAFMRFGKEAMRIKYEDFVSFSKVRVKHTVVEGREDEVPSDIDLMNRDELIAFINQDVEQYPINVSLYMFDNELRQAIRDCDENLDMFKSNQSALAARVGTSIEDGLLLASLNGAISGPSEIRKIVSGEHTPVTSKVKKTKSEIEAEKRLESALTSNPLGLNLGLTQ